MIPWPAPDRKHLAIVLPGPFADAAQILAAGESAVILNARAAGARRSLPLLQDDSGPGLAPGIPAGCEFLLLGVPAQAGMGFSE